MKISEVINKRWNERVYFIMISTAVIFYALFLIFYNIFLLLPALCIKLGFIAPVPLFIIMLLFLIVPLVILVYKFPVFGEMFLSSVVKSPYKSIDVKTAIELDHNRGYPNKLLNQNDSLTRFLSDKFSNKISEAVENEKPVREFLFPDKIRIFVLAGFTVLAVLLSIFRITFLGDIITALGTGLPAELISIGKVLEFDEIKAHVLPPAYLDSNKVKVTDLKVKNKIRVLEGSKVSIKGELTGITRGLLFFSSEKGLEYFSISIKKNKFFEVSFLAPHMGAFALEFDQKISDKIETRKSRVYKIEAIPDNPPTIEILAPEKNYSVVYGNSFGITFTAKDDYGVLEVNLYHRKMGSKDGYNKELIVRFPRTPKKEYTTTHQWNPILKEGNKAFELVYDPTVKGVEYFIEVIDNNIFSKKGIAKSELRYVTFKNMFTDFKRAIDLIRELIRDGKDLLNDISNKRKVTNYHKKIEDSIPVFSKELKDVLPRSSLINETYKIKSILNNRTSNIMEPSLKSYVSFLEKYLLLLDLLKQSEMMEMTSNELAKSISEFNKGNHDDSFKRLAALAEMLGQDIQKDLDEIMDLLGKGKKQEAAEKMAQLLEKIKNKMNEKMKKAKEMLAKMAMEASKKMQEIQKLARASKVKQEKNITTTKNRKLAKSKENQGEINNKLKDLTEKTKKLTSEIPFISGIINSYANSAKIHGFNARSQLDKKMMDNSVFSQKNVVKNLDNLLKQSEEEMKRIQQIMKGNLDSITPQFRQSMFVFIPKEARYTVPIDYKQRIIEYSKNRGKSNKEIESFWRDVLE